MQIERGFSRFPLIFIRVDLPNQPNPRSIYRTAIPCSACAAAYHCEFGYSLAEEQICVQPDRPSVIAAGVTPAVTLAAMTDDKETALAF